MKQLFIVIVILLLTVRAWATTFYVNVSNTIPLAPYTNWSTASADIQSAINAATNGDLILVSNGVYNTGGVVVYGTLTNRVAINKPVTVQSVNGPAVTVIQGYQIPSGQTDYSNNVRCVYMTNDTVLNGFTIIGGSALATIGGGGSTAFFRTQLAGGGIFCETTNSLITNCILTGNICSSQVSGDGGGAICGGTLYNCTLSNNVASYLSVQGGAAYLSVLNNCLIASNTASMGGGAAYSTLNNCTVVGNSAPNYGSTSWGGGTYFCVANHCFIAGNYSSTDGGGDCDGILDDCILSNNVAGGFNYPGGEGGGCYQFLTGNFGGSLNNCLVISNLAIGYGGNGGGVYAVGPVCNCTIVGNTATNQGGGIYGPCVNCIIYYNRNNPIYTSQNVAGFEETWVKFSCTTPMPPYYNTGDITNDPAFVNPAAGDFHLSSNSPCINAGNNSFVTGTTDLDGNPRIQGGTVDIGAYEYQTPSSILSYAWAQQYSLPTDGSVDYLDLDDTGMQNWQKSTAGLNPTNPASVLAMMPPAVSKSGTGTTVSWQSVNTRTYYLQRSTNLAAQPAFSALQSNLVGQAVTTSFTDASATNAGPYFYRVGVQ